MPPRPPGAAPHGCFIQKLQTVVSTIAGAAVIWMATQVHELGLEAAAMGERVGSLISRTEELKDRIERLYTTEAAMRDKGETDRAIAALERRLERLERDGADPSDGG